MDYATMMAAALRQPGRAKPNPLQGSVMAQPMSPAPELNADLPIEPVSPEDWIPNPKSVAAAMAAALKGAGAMGSIRSVGILSDLLGPNSPQVKKIMAGMSPEKALRGYNPMESGGAYPVLGNNALRYETARPTYNPNVVHYDASGGEQALQIAGLSHIAPAGDRLPVVDRLRNMRNSQFRMQDVSIIPEDQARFIDYDPWFQQFGPKRKLDPSKPYEFYINSGEGMVDEDVFELPMNLRIRDIINDPDLRKEYNMSLALPADSPFHQQARILRDAF